MTSTLVNEWNNSAMTQPTLKTCAGGPTVETPLGSLLSTAGPKQAEPRSPLLAGIRVDQYTIIRMIGSGGGGCVYEASQSCPDRRVALKVIPCGRLAALVASRLQFEAEILGRLRHPGVAQIFAAGVSEAHGGIAWIAMELVTGGQTITAYAASKELETEDRLQLFLKTCDAVTHAHARGILHHDIKPANLLVDEQGMPRLIDFGIAIQVDGAVANHSSRTLLAAGTPAYMSPEQFSVDLTDLDVRADVYSLGVILYELLGRRHPYDLGAGGILEAARAIATTDPAPLPGSVHRTLRGIVGKAIEKDRVRRYESAALLAADIRRFLAGEAVDAVPATIVDTVRRVVRRHRAWAAAGTVSVAAAFSALVGITWFALDAYRQRDVARARLEEAERSKAFMLDTLKALDPGYQGPSMTTADVLANMVRRAGDAGDAATRAAVLLTLGRGLIGVGRPGAATVVLDEALVLQTEVAGENAAGTRETIEAARFAHLGNHDRERARKLWHRELAWWRRNGTADPAGMATFLFRMADSLGGRLQDRVDAVALAREAGEITAGSARLGERLQGQIALARLLAANGHRPEAIELVQTTISQLRAAPPEACSIENRVWLLEAAGSIVRREDPTRALDLHAAAVEECTRAFGPDAPRTFAAKAAEIHCRGLAPGEAASALAALETLFADQRRVLGEDARDTISTECSLAAEYAKRGNLTEAIALRRDILQRRSRLLGPDQPVTISSMLILAGMLAQAGETTEAIRLAEEVAARRERLYGADHPMTIEARGTITTLRDASERTSPRPSLP